jgi:hypothetical protein
MKNKAQIYKLEEKLLKIFSNTDIMTLKEFKNIHIFVL